MRGVDPVEHVGDREVDIVHALEDGVVERVERDGDAVRPASFSDCALRASSEPLVVRVRSSGFAGRRAQRASMATRFSRFLRSSGSPPVRRIFRRRGRRTGRATRVISSNDSSEVRQVGVVLVEHFLRHAVHAAEVAAVGDGDAQVVQRPRSASASSRSALQALPGRGQRGLRAGRAA
jgi:hypothetical protein